jgi:hypothetical protein
MMGYSRTFVIVLSTVVPSVTVLLVSVAACICIYHRRRRGPFFNRGITPIGDDEIATWKVNRYDVEKDEPRGRHTPSYSNASSTYTHKKGPSLIQYQDPGRASYDVAAPTSPRSFTRKPSFDLPIQSPPIAVLAKAPNAREGLTDETIPGDEPFIQRPRRHLSKRNRAPSSSGPDSAHRVRVSQSSSTKSFAEVFGRESVEVSSPRASHDRHSNDRRSSRDRSFSHSASEPQLRPSLGIKAAVHDRLSGGELGTPLSPPPLRPVDIGRAIG